MPVAHRSSLGRGEHQGVARPASHQVCALTGALDDIIAEAHGQFEAEKERKFREKRVLLDGNGAA